MCNFRVGQKVVFVDDNGRDDPKIVCNKLGLVIPTVGCVYTVRDIVFSALTGEPLLLLEEIDNSAAAKSAGWFKEPAAEASRFRPVVTRKTDISVFKAMLNPHKQEQNA